MAINRFGRRQFMASVGLGAAALAQPATIAATTDEVPARKFYILLSLGRIGFRASFTDAMNLAVKHGFEGIDPDAAYFASLADDDLKRLLDDLRAKKLKLGAASLPVEFRKDESMFHDGLAKLPDVAALLQKAGVSRVSTYIMSAHQELTYLQNFRLHAQRLREVAEILKDHGQKFGLEYVGPRTVWRSQRHPFVHTLSEIRELIVAIGSSNMGVQLDSYHWFNAEETPQDILTLRGEEVVTVDLNDAPAGLTLDQQMDLSRELPGATDVIPIQPFLESLRKIGYDGAVHAEPFNAALRSKPIDQACALTAAAMREVLNS
ncbi:MAG: TIM barrel protein [Acidobacteria bacterium]|nr:TIM barrel protein [Acidobacteriota bacterium]